MCKPFHAGKAAQNGLLAARLAARGFTSRGDILECPQGFAETHSADFSPAAALELPPDGFHILANLFKYHAACYFTHAPIECARKLREAHRIAPAAIVEVRLHIDAATDRVCNIASPADGLESKFSLVQTVAMALAGIDTASLGAWSESTARDPHLVRLRQSIAIEFQSGWPPTVAELEVILADGRRVATRHDAGVAERDLAAQRERLCAKFDALVEPVLGAPRSRELREMIGGLDEVADIGPLARLAAR